ncbi:MAG: outer membrane protein assembly factor BamE [Pseudomonadota bacterium]
MRYVFILMVFLCVSCGTALPTVKPYKLDVQQGNVVTSKMLLQLRPGMTKSQVRFIMGTPLIQDSFHGNRWDYVYQMRENGKITEQRRVILDFENELLKAVRGDVVPSGSSSDKSGDDEANIGTRVLQPYKKPEEKSLMSKLQFWKGDEEKPSQKPAVVTLSLEAVKPSVEASAQKTANSDNVNAAAESAAPATEEVKSVLAIPVETIPTPVDVAPTMVPSVAAVEPAQHQGARVDVKAESAPMLAPSAEPAPQNTPVYESAAGMQFDRTLKYLDEVFEQEAKPAVAVPRSGNKVPPKPKNLPVEGDLGFFDRMLEKIGF